MVDPQAGTFDVLDKASGQRGFSANTRKPSGDPLFRIVKGAFARCVSHRSGAHSIMRSMTLREALFPTDNGGHRQLPIAVLGERSVVRTRLNHIAHAHVVAHG